MADNLHMTDDHENTGKRNLLVSVGETDIEVRDSVNGRIRQRSMALTCFIPAPTKYLVIGTRASSAG
jgi:hypothetical protein